LKLDDYETRARLLPGLLALLPIDVAALALGLRSIPIIVTIASLIVAVGGTAVLAGVVRERGRHLEGDLIGEWSGLPTTELLRVRHGADPRRLRRRALIEGLLSLKLPTGEEEEKDPAGTDDVYGAVTAELRERTRDKSRFPIVYAENRNYGFERNLLAMRPIGLACSVASAALLVGVALVALLLHRDALIVDSAIGIGTALLLFVGWIWYPSRRRVRMAAELYASGLLDAAAVLTGS
jgi:hypothetical protein